MPHQRRSGSPRVLVDGIEARDTLCEFELWAAPSPHGRATFLRPPPPLVTARFTPDTGRVGVHGSRVVFRTDRDNLALWLRRLDRWIAYANPVVEE